jgi:hypothetical protein
MLFEAIVAVSNENHVKCITTKCIGTLLKLVVDVVTTGL